MRKSHTAFIMRGSQTRLRAFRPVSFNLRQPIVPSPLRFSSRLRLGEASRV
jgi:hypothetical protein